MRQPIVMLFVFCAIATEAPAMAARHMQFIEVEHSHTTNLGAKSDSAGDIMTFNDDLKEATTNKTVAAEMGFCVRIDPAAHAWQCTFTVVFPDGQLSVAGLWIDSADSSFPITGGTGAYRGMRGVLQARPGAPGAGDRITVDLD